MTSATGARTTIADLPSPRMVVGALPAMLLEDDFIVRLVEALGTALAPVVLTLDNLDAYYDPTLAPEDFLDWLGGWVGATIDPRWSVERKRSVIAHAAAHKRLQGTRAGLVQQIGLLTGEEPEIEESGGVVWSPVPGGALPGTPGRQLVVRVCATDGIDEASLDAIVSAAKPAGIDHRVEVVPR